MSLEPTPDALGVTAELELVVNEKRRAQLQIAALRAHVDSLEGLIANNNPSSYTAQAMCNAAVLLAGTSARLDLLVHTKRFA